MQTIHANTTLFYIRKLSIQTFHLQRVPDPVPTVTKGSLSLLCQFFNCQNLTKLRES